MVKLLRSWTFAKDRREKATLPFVTREHLASLSGKAARETTRTKQTFMIAYPNKKERHNRVVPRFGQQNQRRKLRSTT
jgi:hypothetical protein